MSNNKKTYTWKSALQWYCDCTSPVVQRGKQFKLGSSVQNVCICGKVILKNRVRRTNMKQAG